jgi:hypothetical protein
LTFYINRDRYDTFDLTFAGIPAEQNSPDVPPDTKCTFTVGVVEDLTDELRRVVSNPVGFDCEVTHGHYKFRLRDCKLTAPIPDRDYARHRVTLTFETTRQSVLEAVRPMAPPPPPDQTDAFLSRLHVLAQEHDLLRRKRIQLVKAIEEIEAHEAALDRAQMDFNTRRDQFLATGTPELLAMAHGRGL